MENTYSNLIFNQYKIFHKNKYFLFQSIFRSLFNHLQKINQISNNVCAIYVGASSFLYIVVHSIRGRCNVFQCISGKLKEIGVLRPIFLEYVIS